MGILTENPSAYYDPNGVSSEHRYGLYRYIKLDDFVESFMATYVGENKLCRNTYVNDVLYHSRRAIQELSFDTFTCTQSVEFTVPSTLVFVMPINYVNYVSLGWSDSNGTIRRIYPTSKSSNPFVPSATIQPHGGLEEGDTAGYNPEIPASDLSGVGSAAHDSDSNFTSTTAENFKNNNDVGLDLGNLDADEFDNVYGNITGQRYGLDPQYAQANGSFFIDDRLGKFHFSSNLSGKTMVLKYISDGIPADSTDLNITDTQIPKLAEEAMIKHTLYGILSSRIDTPPATLALLKKERFAETRKAKLRLSNIKLEELTQVLRGASKIIKH
tara:strand:- start:10583 stop:11566 length:984 start_codon:yes stop_codon:yes gene_type:complete